jgi:hypothetical protein
MKNLIESFFNRSNNDRTQYSLENLFKFILRLGTLEFPHIASLF